MRIDVKKFLFMGAVKDKASFFQEAQAHGIIEFIDPSGQKLKYFPEIVDRIADAIKILRGMVHEEQDTRKSQTEAESIAERVIELKNHLGTLQEDKRVLVQEIERIAPFGDFSLEEIQRIETESKLTFRFFTAKTSKHMDDVFDSLILINQNEGLDYFIAIQNEPLIHPDLIELHFTLPLAQLVERLELLVSEIETSYEDLKSLTRYYTLLHQALLHRINEADLAHAKDFSEFELENQLFLLRAGCRFTGLNR